MNSLFRTPMPAKTVVQWRKADLEDKRTVDT